jgi:hypothetical protein
MAEKVALSYNRWAEQRRAELNLVMARQTADWIEARSEAQMALGRVQALEGLATRLKAEAVKDQLSCRAMSVIRTSETPGPSTCAAASFRLVRRTIRFDPSVNDPEKPPVLA